MKKYKWTIIKKSINGEYISTMHYTSTTEAMSEVEELGRMGHQVTLMAYSIWVNNQ